MDIRYNSNALHSVRGCKSCGPSKDNGTCLDPIITKFKNHMDIGDESKYKTLTQIFSSKQRSWEDFMRENRKINDEFKITKRLQKGYEITVDSAETRLAIELEEQKKLREEIEELEYLGPLLSAQADEISKHLRELKPLADFFEEFLKEMPPGTDLDQLTKEYEAIFHLQRYVYDQQQQTIQLTQRDVKDEHRNKLIQYCRNIEKMKKPLQDAANEYAELMRESRRNDQLAASTLKTYAKKQKENCTINNNFRHLYNGLKDNKNIEELMGHPLPEYHGQEELVNILKALRIIYREFKYAFTYSDKIKEMTKEFYGDAKHSRKRNLTTKHGKAKKSTNKHGKEKKSNTKHRKEKKSTTKHGNKKKSTNKHGKEKKSTTKHGNEKKSTIKHSIPFVTKK